MVIIVIKSLLASLLLLLGGVKHVIDILKKFSQGNQVLVAAEINLIILPPALTVLYSHRDSTALKETWWAFREFLTNSL